MAEKAPDAFRTISEVSEWLDTPTYVLRFWESRFPQIKPVKRAGGRRYYRPEDMMLLGGIKKLLHFDEQSIKAVKQILKEHGVKHVMSMSPDLDSPVVSPERAEARETSDEIDRMVAAAETPDRPKVAVKVVKGAKLDTAESGEEDKPETPTTELPDSGITASGTEGSMDVAQATDAPVQQDDGLEDWEREDPRIIEGVPYRLKARRAFSDDQLAELAAVYKDLIAVRDRLQSAG